MWQRASRVSGSTALRRALLLPAITLALAGCTWPMYRYDPAHTGFDATENALGPSNVANLSQTWSGATGDVVFSSPATGVDGSVYVGSEDGKLYAFNGKSNCTGPPTSCAPMWTATLGGAVLSSPALVNGVVYVASLSDASGGFYAFDAAGSTNCSGAPKVCTPLWTAAIGNTESSPAVVNGVVYITTEDGGRTYGFDAAGNTNCSGSPKVCAPLWRTTAIGTDVRSSAAVANGVLYVGSDDGNLYAFDTRGKQDCSAGSPVTCTPLWKATTGGPIWSSPAVAGGIAYVGDSGDGQLYAFDAAGNTNCSGDPKTCTPLWTAATGGLLLSLSSPAIANGVAYIGSTDGRLYAFDATGDTNCSGIPKTCAPLWTAVTADEIVHSSPAVANGVVYIGSQDHSVYAFDATGDVNCSGAPKVCTPLWSATTGAGISASPVVAYGRVFVGSLDNDVYAFSITPPSG